MKIAPLPRLNTITDDELHLLEAHFGLRPGRATCKRE